MSEASYVPLGHFCWPELASDDVAASKKFYGELFAWHFEDVPSAMGNYTIFRLKGLDVAAAYQGAADQEAPHWNSYVAVENADAMASKAEQLGGKIIAGPFDVESVGRMAFIQDPDGAPFALWQSIKQFGIGISGQVGSLCWTELATRKLEACKIFYTALFAWEAKSKSDIGMPYTEFYAEGTPVGGMLGMNGPEWEGTPSHWMPYFAVDDCDATPKKAEAMGGSLCSAPADIPGVGRFAVLKDPQGATFSIIQLLG
jgi:uncharacterized protein